MIRKVLIYFFIITASLYGLREIHYSLLLSQKEGYYAHYRQAFLTKNSYDVLFLGSSRCQMHYNTLLFDSITGFNSFNLGIPGATPKISYLALLTYLEKSNNPDYLFMELDFHFLKHQAVELKDFQNFFPFLIDESFRKNFGKADARLLQAYYNPYYSWPYTGFKNLSSSLHIALDIPGKTDTLFYKGYFKEILKPTLNNYEPQREYQFFHPQERNYLDSIIAICKQKNIDLFLVSSPAYEGAKDDVINKTSIIKQLGNIAKANQLPYGDFSYIDSCSNRLNYFTDNFHMNYAGARIFTQKLSAWFLAIKH